jgi:hypothetical protein
MSFFTLLDLFTQKSLRQQCEFCLPKSITGDIVDYTCVNDIWVHHLGNKIATEFTVEGNKLLTV